MPLGNKYFALTRFLSQSGQQQIHMAFEEIDQLCGISSVAYTERTYWANTWRHPFSCGWLKADYIVTEISMSGHWVVFTHDVQRAKTPGLGRRTKPQMRTNSHVQACAFSAQAVDHLLSAGERFRVALGETSHGRYRSWEHCYSFFAAHHNHPSKEEKGLLCLHLAWYLASWGMLRNSFLGENDYTIHCNAVELLTSPDWCDLYHPSVEFLLLPKNASRVEALGKLLNHAYQSAAGFTQNITDTLTTKVLLGTLGCCPAYDRYFKAAARKTGRGLGSFNTSSVLSLARLYQNHADKFEPFRLSCNLYGVEYPAMKALDMCFFMAGLSADGAYDDVRQ